MKPRYDVTLIVKVAQCIVRISHVVGVVTMQNLISLMTHDEPIGPA